MELADSCGADERVMDAGEVVVDTGREGTDARVMDVGGVVVGTEGSAEASTGVGMAMGRVELVGGGVCPTGWLLGVATEVGWVGIDTDGSSMGVGSWPACVRSGAEFAVSKAAMPKIQIADRSSPESMRRFQLTVVMGRVYQGLEFYVLDEFLVQDFLEPRLDVDKLQIHGDQVIVRFCHFEAHRPENQVGLIGGLLDDLVEFFLGQIVGVGEQYQPLHDVVEDGETCVVV